METKLARLSRYTTSTSERPTSTSHRVSMVRPISRIAENEILSPPDFGHTMSQFGIPLQKELEASKVYRRTAARHSISSFLSGLNSATGSALSGVSLAEISSLSALSLPISYDDLWNPRHYTIARESHEPADFSNANALHPLSTQGVWIGATQECPSDTWTVGVDPNQMENPSLLDGKYITSEVDT